MAGRNPIARRPPEKSGFSTRGLDIAGSRLTNQQLVAPSLQTPADLVAWMGGVQAQDFPASLWAVGLRLPGATEAFVERSIADRSIVRTWAMRHTLHVISALDIHWMLRLFAPRIKERETLRRRQLHLDEATFVRSGKIVSGALRGGKRLTREAIYRLLERSRISPAGQRGIHILSTLALDGLLCFGPREGKQHTFVLLEEWMPEVKRLSRQDSLVELALRYFRGHGPATIQDFLWWSGLSAADAREAVNMSRPELDSETVDGIEYLWRNGHQKISSDKPPLCLLPAFDEYLVGYRDRSASLSPLHARHINAGGGMLSPAVLLDGRIAGVWRRTLKNDSVSVETRLFTPFTASQQRALHTAAQRYRAFLGKSALSMDGESTSSRRNAS